ncbi:MAG TPA: hypothetical protein VFB60_24450 [Ktedonobacteraceae bacterium]|nr:hypothetical protein [Ktedonobacteraceae bacterium]
MIDDTIDTKKSVNMMYSNRLSEQRVERDFALLETLALHVVHKNCLKSRISAFVTNFALFVASLLFLSILILLFDELPFFVFKIGVLTILIISISYFSSVQAKRIYLARQHRQLTSSRLMQMVYKQPPGCENESKYDDRKYLSLLKQDTAAYLYALKTKVPRKGVQ